MIASIHNTTQKGTFVKSGDDPQEAALQQFRFLTDAELLRVHPGHNHALALRHFVFAPPAAAHTALAGSAAPASTFESVSANSATSAAAAASSKSSSSAAASTSAHSSHAATTHAHAASHAPSSFAPRALAPAPVLLDVEDERTWGTLTTLAFSTANPKKLVKSHKQVMKVE
jgi:hypothetical protein